MIQLNIFEKKMLHVRLLSSQFYPTFLSVWHLYLRFIDGCARAAVCLVVIDVFLRNLEVVNREHQIMSFILDSSIFFRVTFVRNMSLK